MTFGEPDETDRRGCQPPPGFEVICSDDLDPLFGGSVWWMYRGTYGPRSFIRPGFRSYEAACRAAWVAFDMAVSVSTGGAEKRRLAQVDPPGMTGLYCVRLDDFHHMEADLLSQIIHDAGSIRRAAKVIDMPKSTLAARVRGHRERGTWPE